MTTAHPSLMVHIKKESSWGVVPSLFSNKKRGGRQGKEWPPPAQLSWLIRKKKSRRYVPFFFKKKRKGGDRARGDRRPPISHGS